MDNNSFKKLLKEYKGNIKEFTGNKPKIVAIYPGENPKNPYMFYYEDDEDGQIYYISGRGKKPVVAADDIKDFKNMIKKDKIRAELIESDLEEGKSFPHENKKAAFEVRTFKEFLQSQAGDSPQYPDHFLINKKTRKIEAGYGSYNIPKYSKYSGDNDTNYVIVSKSIMKNLEKYYDMSPIDYTKKQNWEN